MTLPTRDTRVSFTTDLTSTGTIVHLETLDEARTAVILDATACHPVDAGWPDQGADRAVLRVGPGAGLDLGSGSLTVDDCVVAASDGQTLYLGTDIPVRKGTAGWAFLVAHIVARDAAAAVSEGDTVSVKVDAEYRTALSRGHTACHLASLALNRVLRERWSKEVRLDALGAPDFDGNAIESSRIRENGSTDRYRLNKSLRRKGFATDGLAEALPAVEAAVKQQLGAWITAGAAVTIEREGDLLTDHRYWVCGLPEGAARIACGGTHLSSLSELGGVVVHLSVANEEGTPVLTMEIDAN